MRRRLRARGGAGKSRWNNTSSWTSPSTPIAPRSSAAIAFVLPLATPSKSARSVDTTQSAPTFLRDTVTSPFLTATSQRSTRFPSRRSKRSVPDALFKSGSCPRPPSSPKRKSIVPAGAAGTRLTLTGRVLTTSGRPVANALIDWWQANARGAYDNSGYRFRGHQFTDARGRYSLFTVVPGLYPGRTKHIHVKVQAPRQPVLTTQLFFPNVAGNRSDGIFTSECPIGGWKLVNGRRVGRFDFVL